MFHNYLSDRHLAPSCIWDSLAGQTHQQIRVRRAISRSTGLLS